MRSFLLFLLAAGVSLSAVAKPSSESAREVIDFYFNGQEQGIVLAELKLCEDVYSEGDLKNECKGELQQGALQKGKPFMLWMAFMVPANVDPQKVSMQFIHGGETVDTKSASVSSSMRYRVWRAVTLNRTGDWEVRIGHDNGPNIESLQELNVRVVSASEIAAQPAAAEVEAEPSSAVVEAESESDQADAEPEAGAAAEPAAAE